MKHLIGKTYIDYSGDEYKVTDLDDQFASLVFAERVSDGTVHCQNGAFVEIMMIEQGKIE